MPANDPFERLGVTRSGATGGSDTGTGEIRVVSANATAVELCVLDADDPDWVAETVDLEPTPDGVWHGASAALVPGARYALRADGPTGPRHDFDRERLLLDPYARGARTCKTSPSIGERASSRRFRAIASCCTKRTSRA